MSSQELANKDGEVDTENCPVVEIDSKTYQTYIYPGFGLIKSCGLHIQYGNEIKDSPKKHFWFDIPSPEEGEKPKVTKIVIEDRNSLSAELLKGFDDYISTYKNDKTPQTVLTGLNMGTDFKVLNKAGSEYRKVESALPQASTTVVEESVESTKTTTDVPGDRFTIKQDIEKVIHKGVDVLKAVGPMTLVDNKDKEAGKIEREKENTGEENILNKGNVAKVLCVPISKLIGDAEETKKMFNLSDNSRKLEEMKIEGKSIVKNRGTQHLEAKKNALKASLDALLGKKEKEGHKERITHFTKTNSDNKFGFERLEDSQFQDSIKNYETIKTNLEKARPVLQDLPDPLPVQVYKMINGGDAPIVLYENNVPKLEGDALYKFCDAIQRKVDGLNNVLNKVHHFKQDEEGNFMVAENVTLAFDTKTLPLSESVLNEKERKKYYFNASSLKGFGSMKDRNMSERMRDTESYVKGNYRKLRQGVENTSIQGIGKGIGKAASKGVGKAKGFMSYFTNTKKKLDGPAPAAATEDGATVGGKRKTRKNKARKTRRKVQRKRRQSKKH